MKAMLRHDHDERCAQRQEKPPGHQYWQAQPNAAQRHADHDARDADALAKLAGAQIGFACCLDADLIGEPGLFGAADKGIAETPEYLRTEDCPEIDERPLEQYANA